MIVNFLQSNHEGVLVDAIHDAKARYQGIAIDAGAYTRTSIAENIHNPNSSQKLVEIDLFKSSSI